MAYRILKSWMQAAGLGSAPRIIRSGTHTGDKNYYSIPHTVVVAAGWRSRVSSKDHPVRYAYRGQKLLWPSAYLLCTQRRAGDIVRRARYRYGHNRPLRNACTHRRRLRNNLAEQSKIIMYELCTV